MSTKLSSQLTPRGYRAMKPVYLNHLNNELSISSSWKSYSTQNTKPKIWKMEYTFRAKNPYRMISARLQAITKLTKSNLKTKSPSLNNSKD